MADYPIENTTLIKLDKRYARKLYYTALKQAFAIFKKDMTEEEKKEEYRVRNIYIKTSDLGGFLTLMKTVDNFSPNVVPMRRLEAGSDKDCYELFFEFEKAPQFTNQ